MTLSDEYLEYISSSRWTKRKLLYYSSHEKACRSCKSVHNIHLHHHTYNRLGHEHDDDLVPLCESCHDEVHRLHKLPGHSKSLTVVTKNFIEAAGGTFAVPRRRKTQGQKNKTKKDAEKAKRVARRKKKVSPVAPAPALAVFSLGVRVRAIPTGAALKGISVHTGTLVEQVSPSIWKMELDGIPGSRLAVTTSRMVLL